MKKLLKLTVYSVVVPLNTYEMIAMVNKIYPLTLSQLSFLISPCQAGTCLGNITLCSYGLTIKFYASIMTFKQDIYLMACGADSKDTSGIAIWWKGEKLNVRVRTANKEWKVRLIVVGLVG